MGVELTRLEVCQTKPPKRVSRGKGWEAASEAGGDERAIFPPGPLRNERRQPPLEDEEARIDRGPWIEAASRQPTSEAGRIPGTPENIIQRARPG
jgi:hypothetical protein